MKNIYKYIIVNILFLLTAKSFAQMTVTTSASAAALVSNITGPGVTTINPLLTCDAGIACATFTVTPGTIVGTGAGTSIWGINSGILLCTGHATAAAGSEPGTTSFNNSFAGDPAMATLALTATTRDACELSFDLVPKGDTISFNYIFGSEEYIHSTCGNYDDAFAFFISGPGIVGTQNMALVPGTNVPVMVNTVNGGASFVVSGFGTYSNCTSIAAGSPFTAYYIDNTGNANFAYRGYTKELAAVHSVTPCDTYHIKLAIVDAGNSLYDSGVFIEAASLTSNSFKFDHTLAVGATINGVPNTIVKGCTPTSVKVIASHAVSTTTVLNLSFGGTATNGVDVTTIPTTVSIPAGSSSVIIPVSGLETPATGLKTLVIYLSSFVSCGIVDSISINLLDTPSAFILTPDTTICSGTPVQIRTTGTAGLVYNWSPAASLSSTSVAEPFAIPTVTTTYTMIDSLPGSGCPPIVRNVTITVNNINVAILTLDTSICQGDSLTLRVNAGGDYQYNWAPATSLNNPILQDPTATPTITTTYTLTTSFPGSGCNPVTENVTVTLINVNINIFNNDSAICRGFSETINVGAAGLYTYSWVPTTSLLNSFVQNPIATPTTTTTYTVSASIGICQATDTVTIVVLPIPVKMVIIDTICLGYSDTANLTFSGSEGYNFLWSPGTYVSDITSPNAIITPTVAGTLNYVINVNSLTSPCFVNDIVTLTVVPDSIHVSPRDTQICIGQSINVRGFATPLFTFQWLPTAGIGNSTVINPIIIPDTSATYVVTATIKGCPTKSDTIRIDVQPIPKIFVGENKFVCQFDTLHLTPFISPEWYNHYVYAWNPGTSLNDSTSQTVVFTDTISREIVLTVTTPAGCLGKDSLLITVFHSEFLEDMPNLNFCPGDSMVVKPNSKLTGVSYRWLPTLYLSDSLGATPTLKPITNTNYMVVGTNSNGCKDTASFSVVVHPAAVIFLGDSVLLYPGENYQINPQTNCTQFSWFPPYGLSNPSASNPLASPDNNTKYVVTAATEFGCVAIDSITIYVDGESLIWVPNAFTPGTVANKFFKVYKKGIANLNYFRVFNRWGELLYETNNIDDNGWDGSYKGAPQPMDVYIYSAQAITNTGKLINKQGNFTLLR